VNDYNQVLLAVNDVVQLHWMARRYADGRQSSACHSHNDVTRRLLALGVPVGKIDQTPWARDAGGRRYDGLSDEEAALGREVDWLNDNTQRRVEELTQQVAELQALLAKKPDTVYEVVDATDDEQYYPLGIFLSPEQALSLLDGAEPPYDENGVDSVTLEVRGRKVGFKPNHFWVVASRTWVRDYESEGKEWKAQPITTPNPVKQESP
jgi:hypothetical protein